MSHEQNEDEVRDGYIHKMGTDLGELFHALSNELQWMYWKWCQYRTLFGDKPSRVDRLNEAAPLFFRLVQDVFFEETVLGIARLVGPPSTMNKPNLSVTRLREKISGAYVALKMQSQEGKAPAEPSLDQQAAKLATEVASLVEKAETSAVFVKDWRNRHLAHRDLSLALKHQAMPLPAVSRKNVEDSLAAIAHLLNHIESAFCRATTSYRNSPLHGDAEDLLYVIRDGLAHEKLRHESELQGHPLSDDIANQETL